ncbi:MAG: metal-dependent hydrolase [Pyrinomonadaceae bacterium]|jgi:membrane-bound metal-dependent hydrolase YbcI (DUF457 family)|nr:metal-dependent hydrolase [Pyrinomonadaceae bacterium]
MPYPIAHGLLAASLVAATSSEKPLLRNWKILLLCAALGNLPDCDFFFVWILHMGRSWHRAFSHSIVFSLMIGFGLAMLLAWLSKQPFKRTNAWLLTGAILSHTLLDIATTRSAVSGAQVLWPFSNQRFALNLFPYNGIESFLHRNTLVESIEGAFYFCLTELVLFGTIFCLARLSRSFFERFSQLVYGEFPSSSN